MFALAAVMDNIPNGQPTPRESENKMSGVKKQTKKEEHDSSRTSRCYALIQSRVSFNSVSPHCYAGKKVC